METLTRSQEKLLESMQGDSAANSITCIERRIEVLTNGDGNGGWMYRGHDGFIGSLVMPTWQSEGKFPAQDEEPTYNQEDIDSARKCIPYLRKAISMYRRAVTAPILGMNTARLVVKYRDKDERNFQYEVGLSFDSAQDAVWFANDWAIDVSGCTFELFVTKIPVCGWLYQSNGKIATRPQDQEPVIEWSEGQRLLEDIIWIMTESPLADQFDFELDISEPTPHPNFI